MKINKPLRSRINLERSLISFGLSNVRAEYVKKLNEIRNKVELLLQPINHPTDLPTNEVIQPIANQPMVVNQNGWESAKVRLDTDNVWCFIFRYIYIYINDIYNF